MKVSIGDMIWYESKYRWYDMKVSTGDMIRY